MTARVYIELRVTVEVPDEVAQKMIDENHGELPWVGVLDKAAEGMVTALNEANSVDDWYVREVYTEGFPVYEEDDNE